MNMRSAACPLPQLPVGLLLEGFPDKPMLVFSQVFTISYILRHWNPCLD